MTPSNSRAILNLLGADTAATLSAETVVVRYPASSRCTAPIPSRPAPGLGPGYDAGAAATPMGSKTAWGYNVDFSWVYDGTLIPGWQVIPESTTSRPSRAARRTRRAS